MSESSIKLRGKSDQVYNETMRQELADTLPLNGLQLELSPFCEELISQ